MLFSLGLKHKSCSLIFQDITYNQTTCGSDAFRRGPGQKVIAFSFYGDQNSKKSKARGMYLLFQVT